MVCYDGFSRWLFAVAVDVFAMAVDGFFAMAFFAMAFRWLFDGFSMAFAMAFVWLFNGFRDGFSRWLFDRL